MFLCFSQVLVPRKEHEKAKRPPPARWLKLGLTQACWTFNVPTIAEECLSKLLLVDGPVQMVYEEAPAIVRDWLRGCSQLDQALMSAKVASKAQLKKYNWCWVKRVLLLWAS